MADNHMKRYTRMAMAANGGRNKVKAGDYSGNRIKNYYGRMKGGRAEGSSGMELDHEKAKERVVSKQNEDGSRGAH